MGNVVVMNISRRLQGLICLLACLWPVVAPAQQLAKDDGEVQGNSEFRGKIEGADGKAVEGARVLVYHLSTEELFTSEPTGGNGDFKLTELPYGYFDVAVETPEGVFVADQVINLPPSGKATASLKLTPFQDAGSRPPREFSGSDAQSVGWARVDEKLRGKAFWKSTAGIAIIAGVGAAALLALAATGNNDESPASPTAP